jgi:hypothetical protein
MRLDNRKNDLVDDYVLEKVLHYGITEPDWKVGSSHYL